MVSKISLVLSGGMPRSASTWMYNVARIILEEDPELNGKFNCGWVGDWNQIEKKQVMLIKIHDYMPDIAEQAKLVLYSYRDVRDAIASQVRKFNAQPSLQLADALLAQYQLWVQRADFIMKYEEMLEKKEPIVEQLANVLGYPEIDAGHVIQELEGLNYDSQGQKNTIYHNTNLYHKGHITDGRHGSWESTLSAKLVHDIESKHKDWFLKNGYPLTTI